MRGARGAEHNWEVECAEILVEAGLAQGSFGGRVLYREPKNVRIVVHGDHFTVLGTAKSVDWLSWR